MSSEIDQINNLDSSTIELPHRDTLCVKDHQEVRSKSRRRDNSPNDVQDQRRTHEYRPIDPDHADSPILENPGVTLMRPVPFLMVIVIAVAVQGKVVRRNTVIIALK